MKSDNQGTASLRAWSRAVFTGAVAFGAFAAACGDSNDPAPAGAGGTVSGAGSGGALVNGGAGSGGALPSAGSTAGGGAGAPSGGTAGMPNGGTAGGEAGGTDSGGAGSGGVGGAGGAGGAASAYPQLPATLSLSGCTTQGVGPLCTVQQAEGTFTANCGGTKLTGTVSKDGSVSLVKPETTSATGAKVNTSCTAKLAFGKLSGSCTEQVGAVGETAPSSTQCTLSSDPVVQASFACLELPKTLSSLVLCKEGTTAGGTTVDAGACNIVQDGCNFQAECGSGVTLVGTVSATGVAFKQKLKALADAVTPAGGTPAFLKGAEVDHSCTATVDGQKLTGSCGAGAAGRGTSNTSVCAVEGMSAVVADSCAPLTPSAGEFLFVLDSCDPLKNGIEGNPGIGEPVCAIRQNNCIWEVQCGSEPTLHFEGRLSPTGERKLQWKLATGTPCEATVSASGKVSGKCQVPNQPACPLASKSPVAGGAACPAVPPGVDYWVRGCGATNEDHFSCAAAVQHGCNYMSACTFRGMKLLVSGSTSYGEAGGAGGAGGATGAGRPHLTFNGLPGWSCYADAATEAEISSGDRLAGEYYGQCTNASGGQCRNNYNATTAPNGFRGLQVFFE